MWALGLSNKILFSDSKPFQPRRAPLKQGRLWHRALELTHMDQIQPWWPPECPGEGPAVQTRHGGWAVSILSLCWPFCFCPTFPRLVSHTCSPSKSPWRVLAWNCQLVFQATNPAASHVVQECKQILAVKWFSLYETQLDRLALASAPNYTSGLDTVQKLISFNLFQSNSQFNLTEQFLVLLFWNDGLWNALL